MSTRDRRTGTTSSVILRSARRALWILVALVALLVWHDPAGADTAYRGTSLGGGPAPEFRLTNQDGRMTALSDYRGRTVLLTFLDGHCKDVCPATLQTMAEVQERLGSQAGRVAMVAISVDPWLDEIGRPAFIASQPGARTPRVWDFLTGTLEDLSPIWDAYHVSVVEEEIGKFGVNGEHDTGFFLIDGQGREQLYIQSDAPISVITAVVRQVADGGR